MDEKYLPELMAEKDSLDPSFTHALRLVNQGEPGGGGAVPPRPAAGTSGGAEPDGGRCSVRGFTLRFAPLGGLFLCFVFRLVVFTASFPLLGCGQE